MKKHIIIIMILLAVISILSIELLNANINLQGNIKEINITNNIDKEVIVFVGDSITDKYNLGKFYNYKDKLIINSGISGYKTTNILTRFDNLVEQHNPDKIFLLIGTNDLSKERTNEDIIDDTKKIINRIKDLSSDIKIYYQSIYPVNRSLMSKDEKRHNEDIRNINKEMKNYCEENDIKYLDLYSILEDEKGNLKKEYTKDGLHINDDGYTVITNYLKPYVEE